MGSRIQDARYFKEVGCWFSILFWIPHYKKAIFNNKRGLREKEKKIKEYLNHWMTPCLFLINFNHVFFFHSQFFESVIINNFLTFKEKSEWIHGTPCLWQPDSLSFLRCIIIFTLKWLSLLSCLMTLGLLYSPSFLSPKSSVEGFASWSDMAWGLRRAAASGKQKLIPEFINLFSP